MSFSLLNISWSVVGTTFPKSNNCTMTLIPSLNIFFHNVADHFSIVIRFAGICYGRFMAMRYKFNLVTYVQGPLVIDRRGVWREI